MACFNVILSDENAIQGNKKELIDQQTASVMLLFCTIRSENQLLLSRIYEHPCYVAGLCGLSAV